MELGEDFWTVVGLAAAIATALATSLAVLLSAWWRSVDQASVEWASIGGYSAWVADHVYSSNDGPFATGSVANVGQGTAFHFEAVGVGCRVNFGTEGPTGMQLIPVLRTGEVVTLHVRAEPTGWDEAVVALIWREPSLWRRRRRRVLHRIPLGAIAPRPRYTKGLVQQVIVPTSQEPAAPVLREDQGPQAQLPTGSWLQRRRWWRRLRRRGRAALQP